MTPLLQQRSQKVVDTYSQACQRVGFLDQQLVTKSVQLAGYQKEHADKLISWELDKKSLEVIKLIADEMVSGGLAFLQDLVTQGLQSIFTDDLYTFQIRTDDGRGVKEVNFFITDSRGVETPLEECGGGIQVVVSFIIRVYMIVKLGLYRFLVLDEYFSQLSMQYADGLLDFMNAMVKQLGFKILWVSHNQFFVDKVDRVYEVERGAADSIGRLKQVR